MKNARGDSESHEEKDAAGAAFIIFHF